MGQYETRLGGHIDLSYEWRWPLIWEMPRRDFCKSTPSEETMVEDVWCIKMLTHVMMSRYLCFMNNDISCKRLFMMKSMFSHFNHKGSKHYCRDQDPEMYECMMKNLLCSTFWKFLLESSVLFSIIKLIAVEICRMKNYLFWNGVMIARDSWQGVQTLVTMFSKRRNKLLELW